MKFAYTKGAASLVCGDCLSALREMPADCVQTCVTPPPYYGLRDYGVAGQIGLEETPDAYVARLVAVFDEVRRVLRPDGTLWLNLGDSYAMSTKGSSGKGAKQVTNAGTLLADRSSKIPAGLKPKDLLGIPWRVAFALQAAGWYLRSDIIWAKPNPMPESVTDRPTKAHEYLFLLVKSERYFYDAEAVKEEAVSTAGSGNKTRKIAGTENGRLETHMGSGVPWAPAETRNRRSVWTVTPKPFKGAHFATMPPELVRPCVLAGSRPGDLVLDPFNGSGTTGLVAAEERRSYIGLELNPEYVDLSIARFDSNPGVAP